MCVWVWGCLLSNCLCVSVCLFAMGHDAWNKVIWFDLIAISGEEQRAPAACHVSINPAWSLQVSQTAWDTLSTPVRTYAKESSDLMFVSVGRQSGIEPWTEFTSSASTTQQHTWHVKCTTCIMTNEPVILVTTTKANNLISVQSTGRTHSSSLLLSQ